jgi:metal transporter CNNM
MWIIIVLLLPLAWPISFVLDKILGHELGTILSKDQIKALFQIYERKDRLETGQMRLLSASLDFPEMLVKTIMRPLDQVYMLDIESRFDNELMREIYENGYSRIPVYESTKKNVIGILMSKDLMFLDAERVRKLW